MNCAKKSLLGFAFSPLGLCVSLAGMVLAQGAAQPATQGAVARPVGTVKAISGNSITVNTDSGAEVTIIAQGATRMLRTVPGSKDLKDAMPIQLSDLQIGDRILVRGVTGGDGKSVEAASIIVMKQTDVAKTQAQEREDWQRRGVGGLVKGVDPAGQTITISTAPNNAIVIHTSKDTGFLRYAPDSVKFSDATKGEFGQIQPGDQLRARGARAADGKELTAEEIISGSFRNIAGTINSVDAGNGKVVVMDLLTKKQVTVRITGASQLHKLPEPIATRIAKALKGTPSDGAGRAATAPAGGAPADGKPAAAQAAGPPDLQQILNRTPVVTLADLQKGDAVMIVTTPSTVGSDLTAVTMVAGVEPILTAAPSGSGAASLLSAWNMSAGDAGGD